MNHRAVLAGVCGVLLLSDASQSAAPQQNPTPQDAPLPRASAFLFNGSTLIQPTSKEERDARLREIRAQYRASEAQKVRPWISLAEKLGSFAGQLTGTSLTGVEIVYEGTPSLLNTRALTQAALNGLLRPFLAEVNMVNAPVIAKERGVKVSETRRDAQGIYEGYIKLVVSMSDGTTRRVAGTVFSDGRPRLIQIKDIGLDAEFAPHMLYVVNEDKPGFIGKLGTLLGDAKVNIANFTLGRSAPGQDAIALIEVDGAVPEAVAAAVANLPLVKHAKPLAF